MFQAAAARRVVTWSAIIGYGLIASGLPLPLGVARPDAPSAAAKRLSAKDRSMPFPCMDKPCGCATAEQCFNSCCCHTAAETLAWAQAHDVEPAVITALQRRVAVAVSAHAEPSCCSAKKTSCCEAAAPPHRAEQPAETPQPKTVSLRAMLACGGIVAEWFSCGGSLPPPAVVVVTGLEFVEPCQCADERSTPGRTAPDVPPPRLG